VLWLWILLGVLALLVVVFVLGFNRIVRLRNEASTGWSNIDVQLKRRADLIPNLVETVKAYAAHEREVFRTVTEARSSLLRAAAPGEAAAANAALTEALGRLFAVAEAYPELKASQNFLRLQDELTDTEDKIAAARRYYNATVMRYNTAIQSFPGLLYAGAAGFRPREFFEAEEEAHELPRVELTSP
jgi:LemA protein